MSLNKKMIQSDMTSAFMDPATRQLPNALPEVRAMLKMIGWIGWANLIIGLPSVLLVLNLRSLSLVATGFLSILTFSLLRMIVRHITHTASWIEAGVAAMCGIYLPIFIIWLCATNLVECILR